MKDKKPKRRALADMDFDEGLARLIQTNPAEVHPPQGRKPKKAKTNRQAPSLPKAN